jgi:hypothetical protein
MMPSLRGELAALLAGLTPGDWARPTACPGRRRRRLAARLDGAADRGGGRAILVEPVDIPPGPRRDEATTAAMRFLDAGIESLGRPAP